MKTSYGSVPTTVKGELSFINNENEEVIVAYDNEGRVSLNTSRFAIGFLFIMIGLFAVTSVTNNNSKNLSLDEIPDESSLSFSVTYDYVERDGAPGENYPWFSNYNGIVEPYREATLYVTEIGLSITRLQETTSYIYEWTIDELAIMRGNSITYTFTQTGAHNIKLFEIDSTTGLITRQIAGRIMCKYVRREVRQLFESDRIDFLDTMEILFKTDEDEGRGLYGNDFHGIDFFTRIHNNMAGAKECDHFHNGLGFSNHHVAFTLLFEKSLQSINPKVTVPYWDYTIEAHYVYNANGDIHAWRSSIAFDDDWFGSASPKDYIIDSGRWAYTPVMSNSSKYSSITNAYGFMRSPWNQNKIPYVTRHNQTYGYDETIFPDCGAHYVQLTITDFYDFGMDLENEPHGLVHTVLGGAWNADIKKRIAIDNDFNISLFEFIGTEAFAWQKNMWRAGLLSCPTMCSMDTPQSECKCTCPMLTSWLENKEARSILYLVGDKFQASDADKYFINNAGEEKSDVILRTLCNDYDDFYPTLGDNIESASSNDVIFWPTHPTVDRLFTWRRINGFSNETWVDNSATSVRGLYTGYCYGHNREDVTIWNNLFDNGDYYYTNEDIYHFTNPSNEYFPYVYDNFRWSHCAEEGYPLDLLESSQTSYFYVN